MQQLQGGGAAHGRRDGLDGGGVVEVAPGGGLDEQQVVAYESGDDAHVLLVEADPGGHVAGDDLAGHGVVAGPPLADVVQEGGDQEQVGAVDAAGEGGGADGGLHEVPVDGPGVDGVALGAAVDTFPVGQQPGDDPLRLQGLPDGDGGLARAEQGDQFLAGLGGPGHRQRPGGGRQVAYEVAGERESGLGGGRGGAQGEDGVAFGAGGAGEDHFPVRVHHAVGERGALGGGPGAEAAGEQGAQLRAGGAGAQDPLDLAPGDVGGVRDRARGFVDLAQQGVGVEQAERSGDLVLFLEGEAVGGASGGEVEGVADVEEGAARPVEPFAGGVGDPGGGDGAQGGGVAEAAAGLLEVGFQEERELARPFRAFPAERDEGGEPSGGLVAPVGEDRGAQGGDEAEVAGDRAGVEQAELDLEVLAGGLPGLGGGAYGVVEGDAQVPDRVPDGVREGGEGGRVRLAVVQQEQVEVAARGEFAAPVAADGDEGGAAHPGTGGGGREEAGEPVVGEAGEGRTARRPGPRLLLEEAQPGRRVAAGSRAFGFGGRFGTRHPRCLPFVGRRSEGVRAALTGPHADGGVDRDAPDLPVTDLAGAGGLDDDFDELFGVLVLDEDLDTDLGDQVDGVLGAPVDLGVAALPPVTAGLGDGEPVDAEGLEGLLDLVQPVRLHDRGDELHASTFFAFGAAVGAGAGAVVRATEPPPVPLKS